MQQDIFSWRERELKGSSDDPRTGWQVGALLDLSLRRLQALNDVLCWYLDSDKPGSELTNELSREFLGRYFGTSEGNWHPFEVNFDAFLADYLTIHIESYEVEGLFTFEGCHVMLDGDHRVSWFPKRWGYGHHLYISAKGFDIPPEVFPKELHDSIIAGAEVSVEHWNKAA